MPQPVLQNTSCRGKRQLILKYSGIYNFVQSYLFLYLAMMKHLYYILMFTFLCLGLTTISQEEQPDSRNTTGSPAGIVVGSPASECSFTAYTHITTPLRNSWRWEFWNQPGNWSICFPAICLPERAPTFHSIPVPSAIPADTTSMHCCISWFRLYRTYCKPLPEVYCMYIFRFFIIHFITLIS